jgi:hypothetical protein
MGSIMIKSSAISILFMIMLSFAAPAFAVESISVSCYADNFFVGNVTVYNVSTAADACNSLYYACKGICSGCFSDFDYVEEVCVDTNDRLYLK